jgi:hypothetical protein
MEGRERDYDENGFVRSDAPHTGYAVIKDGEVTETHPRWNMRWNENNTLMILRIMDLEKYGYRLC